MLPIGSKPVLEHLIAHLASVGVRDVTIATHYLGDTISRHFGDGAAFGLRIRYLDESQPLGTAGALRLVPAPTTPLLVVNGDIMTRLDVGSMVRFHREHHASLTVGVRTLEAQVPYGVVEVRDEEVISVLEKPTTLYFVNAGLYLIEPAALAALPPNPERIDMPDFICRLLAERQRVVGFPVREYWLDIGHPQHYAQAQADFAEGRF
jgi:NDP-sugar pyrophosphorylase family protein